MYTYWSIYKKSWKAWLQIMALSNIVIILNYYITEELKDGAILS